VTLAGLSAAPTTFPLRRGRGAVALHATGVRHPGHLAREVFTPFEDVTHVVLLGRSLRLATKRSVYLLPRRIFRERDAPERLLHALVERLAAQPGGLVQLSRMAELDRRGRNPGPAPVSVGLALLCALVFALQRLFGDDVNLAGFFSRTLVLAGEPWRLVTANLLHADVLHLAFNALAILFIGMLVERPLGSARTAFVVVLSGLAAMGASFAAGYEDAVGASGIAFGLAGAMLFLELRRPAQLPATWRIPRRILIAALAVDAVLSASVPFVAGLAHAGGFAAGVLACALVAPAAFERTRAPAWLRALNAVSAVVLVLAIGAAAREVVGAGDVLARRGERLLEMPGVTADLLNNTAWLLATGDEATSEQVEVAVRLAQRAVRDTDRADPNVLDTLAEAQFQAGRSDEAIATIDEAIALAPGEAYFTEQRRRFTGERAADDRPAPPGEGRPFLGPEDRPDDELEPPPGPGDGLDGDDEDNPTISV
jgi:membrane associated rhomboid family serine protease